MWVQCPQCGKSFEISDSQSQRVVKCTCQNSFRAKALPPEKAKQLSEAKASRVQLTAFPQEELEDTVASSEETLNDEEMNNFVGSLKDLRKAVTEKKSDSPIEKPISLPAEIEVHQPNRETGSQPLLGGLLAEESVVIEDTTEFERLQPKPEQHPAIAPKKVVQHKLAVRVAAGIFSLIVVSMIVFSFSRKRHEEAPPDPYLQKLLTQQPQPTNTATASTQNNSQTAATIPAPKSTPSLRSTEVATAAPTDPRPSSLYEKLYVATLDGNFENVIRLASGVSNLSENEKSLLYEALVGRSQGDDARLSELSEEIEHALIAYPDSTILVRAKAAATVAQSKDATNLAKGIEILKSLMLTRAQDPLVYYYLGNAYLKLEREDLANSAWDQALGYEPRFTALIQKRIHLAQSEKNYAAALQMAEKLKQIPGKEAEANLKMSELSDLMNHSEAATHFAQQAAQNQNSASAHLILGNKLAEKNPAGAAKEFEAALKLSPTPNEKKEIYFALAKSFCKMRAFDKSIATFSKAVALDRHSATIYFQRGSCEMSAHKPHSAAKSFELALRYSPNSANIWLNYGEALSKTQKTKAALAAFKKSLALKETYEAHYQLAVILLSLKDRTEAKKHLKRCLKLNPNFREASALERRAKL